VAAGAQQQEKEEPIVQRRGVGSVLNALPMFDDICM
jgi:hypothetical protein